MYSVSRLTEISTVARCIANIVPDAELSDWHQQNLSSWLEETGQAYHSYCDKISNAPDVDSATGPTHIV